MSIIVFEVLSKSLGPSLEGSKISLSEVIGYWVLDISIEGLAFGRGTSSSFSLSNESWPWADFLLNMSFWQLIPL